MKIGFGEVAGSRTKINAFEDQVEKRYMDVKKQSIDPNIEIIGVYLHKEDLFVVSEKRIFKLTMVSKDQVKK